MTSSNDAKATMKAARIHAFGGPEQLRYEDAPRPAPNAGEVLIRIYASAVNPADWKLRSGLFGKDIPLPLILGFDFSGVIDTLGEGVTRWKIGDEVYGYALGGSCGIHCRERIDDGGQTEVGGSHSCSGHCLIEPHGLESVV